MICYICEEKGVTKDASRQCPACGGLVCGDHTRTWKGKPYCLNCAEGFEAEDKRQVEETRRQDIKRRTCDFCGQIVDLPPEWWLPHCDICGRQFCENCGWRKFKGYRLADDGWEGYIKVAVIEDRCNKHAGSLWRIGASRCLAWDV